MSETRSGNRRVVIAMDGSQYSEYAFEFHRNVDSSDFRKEIQQDLDMHSELESRLHQKLKSAGISGTVHSCFGKAGEAIVQAARENKAEVIVCGTRGHGKFRRTIMGSVSSYLVHHSDVPVIVCRHKDHHDHHGHPRQVIVDSPSDACRIVHD